MGRSQMIRSGDVQALLRLTRELKELPEDRDARIEHFLTSVNRLMGAQVTYINEAVGFRPGRNLRCLWWSKAGHLDERGLRAALAVPDEVDKHGPMLGRVLQMALRLRTCRRREVVSDGEWYRSEYFQAFPTAWGTDDIVASVRPLDSKGHVMVLGTHRSRNDRPFSLREQNLMDLVNQEFGWFYRYIIQGPGGRSGYYGPDRVYRREQNEPTGPLPTDPQGRVLPRQVRRTLARLLAGDSEKQAAEHLGISRHTVHAYAKQLYRRFGVSSRGELLARCLNETPLCQTDTDPDGQHPPAQQNHPPSSNGD